MELFKGLNISLEKKVSILEGLTLKSSSENDTSQLNWKVTWFKPSWSETEIA